MKKQSKKAQRAPGQTTLTISLPEDLKERIEKAAQEDARSTSNYLVKELMKLLGADGSGESPRASGGQDKTDAE